MPISLQCPQCGKGYRLRDALAGKRVKCGCGAVIAVAGQAAEAAGPPTEHELDEQYYPELLPPAPPRKAAEDKANSAVGPPGGFPRVRKPQGWHEDRWRTTVGVLSILYGTGMVPFVLVSSLWFWPVGPVKLVTQVILAVLIAAGGVLILKRHKHGPACAGLSCLFFCFFRVWFLLLGLLSALSVGELGGFVLILAGAILLYSIPVCITIWCLKQEVPKETETEPPL
jgi:hypothetical protein